MRSQHAEPVERRNTLYHVDEASVEASSGTMRSIMWTRHVLDQAAAQRTYLTAPPTHN
jgi:hypothetical protein